jgi:polyphenol oxidase
LHDCPCEYLESLSFSGCDAIRQLPTPSLFSDETPACSYYGSVPKNAVAKADLKILHAERLARVPWLAHGFSTRLGGTSRVYGRFVLNLGFTRDDSRAAVERNRATFLQKLQAANGKELWPIVTLRQVHSDLIHCVSSLPEHPLTGDGLLTTVPGLLLTIQTADCLPVILVDTKRRAVGVFHAGWRGTVKRIVEKGVGEMRRWFGTLPRDLKAAIGPGIHNCCYAVGPEVVEKFESQFAYASELFHEVKESDPIREKYPLLFLTARAPGHSELPRKILLDLAEANRRQLISSGVPAGNIEASELCSSCRTDLLFSYRAEKGVTGRMMAAAGIRP